MIINIIVFLFGLVLLQVSINRYLHIMQQSFYNFTDYMPTLRNTKRLKINIAEIILLVLMLVNCFALNSIYIKVLWCMVCLFTIIYDLKHKPTVKKKFVLTTRVKVIYTVYYLLTILNIILIICLYKCGKSVNWLYITEALLISLYKHLAIFIVALCNLLAKPIVAIINSKYINEAKHILKDKSDMKIIGITGSYGKTSTKNIVNAILSEKYSSVMTPKSFNTTLGVVRSIRENIRSYTETFVCEMGASHLNDIKKICKIVKPDISIITSIGPQHLMTFKSIENVEKGKFEIVKYSKEDAIAVLNIDNEYIKDGIDKYLFGRKVLTYSISNDKADYYVKDISISENGSSFKVISKDNIYDISTKLLGKHNIYNIVCGIVVANIMNVEKPVIEKAISKLQPVEHRLQLKKMQDILVLDDSFNSNPEGSKSAIECLEMFKDNYRVLVTPGMIELGSKQYELNKKLGEYATSLDYVLLVGDKTTKPLKDGMDEKNFKNYEVVKDIYEAFTRLNEIKKKHSNLIALIENDLMDSYS